MILADSLNDCHNFKSGRLRLLDASNAGTKHASECTLIITESDSGAAFAIAGLGVMGRAYFGVYSLCGKPLNVRDATIDEVRRNQEIHTLQNIIGLQPNNQYTSISGLRYGRLMLMTDRGPDGFHIKGLLISFLDYFYPSLLKVPDFLVDFVTPIIPKRRDLLTISEYERWLKEMSDGQEWPIKHITGLQDFSEADARCCFTRLGDFMTPFSTVQEGDRELLDLAFCSDKTNERIEWLRRYQPGMQVDRQADEVSLSDFINKDLILYFKAENGPRVS